MTNSRQGGELTFDESRIGAKFFIKVRTSMVQLHSKLICAHLTDKEFEAQRGNLALDLTGKSRKI